MISLTLLNKEASGLQKEQHHRKKQKQLLMTALKTREDGNLKTFRKEDNIQLLLRRSSVVPLDQQGYHGSMFSLTRPLLQKMTCLYQATTLALTIHPHFFYKDVPSLH